ncbi:hypothetical protein V3C99_000272 [Haemonchus contortus]|nr:unnamed protein product [Haemonchus contortus]
MIRLPFYLTVIEFALGCASNSTTTTTTSSTASEVVFARFRSVLPWNASETSAYEDAYESAITPKLNELGHVLNVESGNLHGNFALSYTIGNTNCDRVKAAMESIRNDADFIESHSVICG